MPSRAKMVIHTRSIRRQQPTNCLNVLDHFVRLRLKGLKEFKLINFYSLCNHQRTYGFLMILEKVEVNLLKFSYIRSQIWILSLSRMETATKTTKNNKQTNKPKTRLRFSFI